MNLHKFLENSSMRRLIALLIRNRKLREPVIRFIEKKTWDSIVENDPFDRPPQVQRDKYDYLIALLHSADRGLQQQLISKHVQERFIETFVHRVLINGKREEECSARLGFRPPGFLVISPTKLCNLHCTGCYACSDSTTSEKLDFVTLDRILTEKDELWSSSFTVISGGEPFMWRDDGKDIIDIAAKHSDNFFLVYTNGTLINKETAKRLEEVGNITPAISVEGFEEETDKRRGKGVHRRILKAFENLREVGVPFGISITALRHNWDIITSDDFADFYFDKQGALYAWIFQYMPIGRKHTLDSMVTPEQRLKMLERTWRWLQERKIFVADFWNSGPASTGCIAAGRAGGYLYINWNGDVTPCAFIPYAAANVYEVFKNNGNLNTILHKEFFRQIRQWQNEYGYTQSAKHVSNLFCPCPIRDHHDKIVNMIRGCQAWPIDSEAKKALEDEEYHQGLTQYGIDFNQLSSFIWDKFYESDSEVSARGERNYRSEPGWVSKIVEQEAEVHAK